MHLALHSLVRTNVSIYDDYEADRLRADICDLSNHQITNLTHVALGYAHNLAASGRSFNASQPESGAIDAHRAFLGCVSVLSA